jgi:hypothetical protein
MSGGGGNLIESVARQNTPSMPGASYTPVSSNVYSSSLPSNSAQQMAPVMSPLVRQMTQQYTPIQAAGLSAMINALANQPQSGGIAGLPTYRPSALGYRPNMQAVQQNLSRGRR